MSTSTVACPGCLAAVDELRLVDAFGLPVGELVCPRCGRLWQLELTLVELARLLAADAPGLRVRRGPQAVRLANRTLA